MTPSPVIVTVGEEAQYNCSHFNTTLIRWIVNNHTLGRNTPQGITPGITNDEGISINTLTIMAFLERNKTEVVCEAVVEINSVITLDRAQPVQLFLQGKHYSATSWCSCTSIIQLSINVQ